MPLSTFINLEPPSFFVINNLIFHTVHGCCENFKNVCSFELKIVLTVVLKNQNSFLYFKNQIMRMDGGSIWCWSQPPVTLEIKSMQVYSSTKSYSKNCKITLKVICDQIKITCSKSDLRSDQDHDLEHHKKVIANQIVISDHSIIRSLNFLNTWVWITY